MIYGPETKPPRKDPVKYTRVVGTIRAHPSVCVSTISGTQARGRAGLGRAPVFTWDFPCGQ